MEIDAKQIHEQFLQQRADFHAAHNNSTTSTIIKRIIQTEQSRTMYRTIKYTIKNKIKTSLNTIQINNDDGTIQTLQESEQIHKEILEKTQSLFEEINTLPIGDHAFNTYIGEYAQNDSSSHILNNTQNNNQISTSPMLTEFMNNLKRPNNIPKNLIETQISPEEFISSFQTEKGQLAKVRQ